MLKNPHDMTRTQRNRAKEIEDDIAKLKSQLMRFAAKYSSYKTDYIESRPARKVAPATHKAYTEIAEDYESVAHMFEIQAGADFSKARKHAKAILDRSSGIVGMRPVGYFRRTISEAEREIQ